MTEKKEIILAGLRKNRDRYLSGSHLSEDLNISRAAVWKHVQKLRAKGYSIDAIPRQGYRLIREPVQLDVEKLEGSGFYYYQTLDSTNTTARKLAEDGAPNYSIVVSEQQVHGRGRRGREWFSPKASGLWFSIILRPHELSPSQTAPVTLVTAAILANLFNNYYELPLKIKWPNDLLLRRKKIGGILTELKGELDQVEYLIVGVGLNVSQKLEDFPKNLRKIVTSLHLENDAYFNRTDLLLKIRDSLVNGFNLFFTEGFTPFYLPWKENNVTLGQIVTLSWQGGIIQGKALHITLDGALQIQDNRGKIHTINYGELI
ncbi:MAG: biotin--[acetyl-CoA-carboxylase] ligase [Bacillota bacterium]